MKQALIIAAWLLAASFAHAQARISLRHLAIVDPDEPVTLAMIARFEEGAAELGDLVIIDTPQDELVGGERATEIDIDRVRRALRESGRADLSHLVLRGSTCVVRPIGMQPVPTEAGPERLEIPPVLASTLSLTTLKGHVAVAIARTLDVDPRDLRLVFDPRDARLLATPVLGRTVDAVPIGLSDDVPVRFTIYDRDRIVLLDTVRVGASVRRDVCVMTRSRRRTDVISADDFIVEKRWLPATDEPIDAAEAAGLSPRTSIRAGSPLLRDSAEAPIIVERGDLVSVHCVSGPIVLQMPARALADARDGETIEFEHLKGKGTFRARMSGKGRAVAVPSLAPVQQQEQRP